jgi:hypothetical protein
VIVKLPIGPTFDKPFTIMPVSVICNILALPFTETLTLPLADGILTLLLPLLMLDVLIVVQLKLPLPLVCRYCPLLPPVIITLPFGPKFETPVTTKLAPTFALPDTSKLTSVPTLVIFGCAFASDTIVPFRKLASTRLPPLTLPADKLATLKLPNVTADTTSLVIVALLATTNSEFALIKPMNAFFATPSKYCNCVPRSLPSSLTGAAPFGPPPRLIIGSSTVKVSMLMYVMLPLTARLPPTTALPVTLSSPVIVVLPLAFIGPVLAVAFNSKTLFAESNTKFALAAKSSLNSIDCLF